MKERARGQERWEERLPGGGSCLGKGPKEEGAWCVRELERKPVYLYTCVCTCTLTHAYISIIPRTLKSAPASSESINSAPSPGNSLFYSVCPSNLQVQFETTSPPLPLSPHTAIPNRCQPHLVPSPLRNLPGLPLLWRSRQSSAACLSSGAAAAACFTNTHDSPNEALPNPGSQA